MFRSRRLEIAARRNRAVARTFGSAAWGLFSTLGLAGKRRVHTIVDAAGKSARATSRRIGVMYQRGIPTMSENKDATRRDFLKGGGRIAGASALAGVALPYVHAQENNTIQLALVGCGGRGTGATENALGINNGPIKLVAMADVLPAK